jgi:hypothetical protein
MLLYVWECRVTFVSMSLKLTKLSPPPSLPPNENIILKSDFISVSAVIVFILEAVAQPQMLSYKT